MKKFYSYPRLFVVILKLLSVNAILPILFLILLTNHIQSQTISSFSPTFGGNASTITITGTGLTGATAVKFGGIEATSFSVVNSTTITALPNPGSSSGNVSITTPGGTVNLPGFTWVAPSTNTFNYTGSTQTYTVPAGVTSVTITAIGAQGGNLNSVQGGYGANITGTFAVSAGNVLTIFAGEQGIFSNPGAGGGGGSGVLLNGVPLIVAGGGGGASWANGGNGDAGYNASTTTSGVNSSGAGGTGGGGGQAGDFPGDCGWGAGGGGYTGNGVNGANGESTGYGYSETNGGTGGGGAGCSGGSGGWGFGGGGSGSYGGGGGGGYSGGGGGQYRYGAGSSKDAGGGGGSYNAGTLPINTISSNTGNGVVTIGYTIPGIASVTTNAITNLTATTATCGGDITCDGGSTITARGVCWSTSPLPTTALSTKTTDAGTTGNYASSITGLTATTTYYVRAYANNSVSTVYGNQVTFTTLTPQTITFNSLSNVTYGVSDFNPGATASSSLTVTYSSSNTNVATIVGGNIHIVGAGNTTIYADQAGNSIYAAATEVSQGLLVNTKSLTVTGATGVNKVYDGSTAATITGGTLMGIVGSDVVNLSTATSGIFASADVGTNISITPAMTLTGAAAGNYTLTQPTLDADITAKTLTVLGASGVNKAYDGTANATITGGMLFGVIGSDVVNLATATSGTFASAGVGTDISITPAMTLTGTAAGNYTLTQPALSANITPLALTVTGATAENKVYDGTTTAVITGGTLTGNIGSDVVNLATATSGTFASVNAGTGISVTSAMTLTGAAAGNYTLTQPVLSANITPLTLSVTGAMAENKVYDGTTTATITGGSLAGVVGSDVVTLSTATSGTFATEDVGTAITVNPYMTLSGAAAGNYTLTQPLLSADITAKTLTVAGASAGNKVYDGTTTASITGGTLDGVIGSDVVTLATATSGTFASSGVGSNISIIPDMTLTGADGGNYTLTQPVLSANITPLALTLTGATAENKVYDRNTSATITGGSLVGVVGSDMVNLATATSGTFASANAGTDIAVTPSMTLTGADSANYTLIQPLLSANITPLALTVTGATAENKLYDGSTSATVTGGSLSGILDSDVVLLATATFGTFASDDVGSGIAVTSYMTLTGADAGNYSVTQPALAANITPLSLTVNGATGVNKVYDGTTNATITGGALDGVIGSDVVTLATGTSGTFASANVGTDISITQDMTLTGADAGNYTLTQPVLSANITPLALTVTGATAENKTYDGNTSATISGGSLVGILGSDVVTLANATSGTFSTDASGVNIPVTTDMTLTGPASGNYTVIQPSLTADIIGIILTVNGATASDKVYDGNTAAAITGGTLVGVIGSDVVILSNSTSGNFASANVGMGITVTSVMSLSGADAAKYMLTQPAISANITPLTLTVTGATAENIVYDGTTTDTIVGAILVGIVGEDDVMISDKIGTFASANVGTGITVTSAMTITGAAAGNYTLTQPVLTGNIKQRPIMITANAESKMKGTVDPALTYSITSGSLVGEDDLTGTLTRQPGETVGTYNIEIGTLSAGTNYDITFVSAIFTIDVNTGVITITETKLVVYPNPATDYVYIANIPENTTINVYNMLGNLVKSKISISTTEQVDINDLPSGVYIIRLSGTQTETAIRLIKQ
jgi:hypothetical protein